MTKAAVSQIPQIPEHLDPHKYCDIHLACFLLDNCSRTYVTLLKRQGKIRAIKIGAHVFRYELASIRDYLKERAAQKRARVAKRDH